MRGSFMMRRLMSEKDSKPTKPVISILFRLMKYTFNYKRPLIIALICIVMVSGLQLIIPQLTKITIDEIIPKKDVSHLLLILAAVLGTAVILSLCSFIRSYSMSIVGQNVIFELRNKLYNHIQYLSLNFFYERKTGELMSRITNDVGSVQMLITMGANEIVADIITFIAILTLMFILDWKLTLLIFITLPLIMLTTWFFGKKIRNAFREVQKNIANINSHLQETISNIHVIKSFANEDFEMGRFLEHNIKNKEVNLRAVKLWASYFPLIDIMTHLGTVAILGFGSYRVMYGPLTIGTLVAFMAYQHLLQMPIRRFGRIMNVIQQSSAATERIFDVLDTIPDIKEKENAEKLPDEDAVIEFNNVSFSYNKSNNILEDFTLKIKTGMKVALVGPSGAGKTTVINLLLRFFEVDKGSISIGGLDIKDLTFRSLRNYFGIVPQDVLLLNGTFRENIAYAKPDVSDGEVIKSAKYANIHDFIISLENGYNTQIGERGVKLSGGQRQRVAIARAMLKNPHVLIFDEATNQLDSETEMQILEVMDEILRAKTAIVIAHRLSTVRKADLIIVIKNGKIVESGKHDELISKKGCYASLYETQNIG